MESTFSYPPLKGSREIRLVKLHTAISEDQPLSFSLYHAELSDGPKYFAISYTWDGQGFDHEASCDSIIFKVSKNCDNILRHLRHRTEEPLIWIDQICIDQTSAEEKSTTIPLMAEIFSCSTAVLIWTGPCHTGLVSFLERLIGHHHGNIVTTEQYIPNPSCFNLYHCQDANPYMSMQSKYVKQEQDISIAIQFDRRSWFHRMWTFQEITMVGHGEVYLLSGALLFRLDSLRVALNSKGMNWMRQLSSAYNQMRSFAVGGSNKKNPISHLLWETRHRGCTDPRDKVFALYWCIRPLRDQGHMAEPPAPNYALSTQSVYLATTRWALESLGDTGMLCLAAFSSTSPADIALPSWVPDFRKLAKFPRRAKTSALLNLESQSASRRSPKSFIRIMPDGHTLQASGVVIDKLEYISAELPAATDLYYMGHGADPEDELGQWGLNLHSLLFEFFSGGLWPLRKDPRAKERFCRSILLNSEPDDQKWKSVPTHRWYVGLELRAKVHWGLQGKHADLVQSRLFADILNESLPGSSGGSSGEEDEDCFENVMKIFGALENHRLFTTKSGLIGVAVGAIEAGDALVLFGGVDHPLILRPHGDKFHLRGIAFVHGLMRDEGWPEEPEDSLKLTTFHIH